MLSVLLLTAKQGAGLGIFFERSGQSLLGIVMCFFLRVILRAEHAEDGWLLMYGCPQQLRSNGCCGMAPLLLLCKVLDWARKVGQGDMWK